MKHVNRAISMTIFAVCLMGLLIPAAAENWPAWRGSDHNGISSESDLPIKWSPDNNIKWRLELAGPAPSTPVVYGENIFLTSTVNNDFTLMAVGTDGKVRWEETVGSGNRDIRQGESNTAAPSPVTDGEHVWAFFADGSLVCLTVDGKRKWRTNLAKRYAEFDTYHGMATSPLLDGDRLYFQLLHSGAQVVLALDKSNGDEIWKHTRKTDAKQESMHSYASPILYRFGEQELLITHGADYTVAHQLTDGKEVWRSGGFQKPGQYNGFFRFVSTPVASEDLIVAPSAKNGPTLGINPQTASGDITDNAAAFHWRHKNGTTDVPSPLIHDGLVYICRENGVLQCIDAASGEEVYQESVYRKRHRGSPVYADGHIYLMAMDGTVSVIKAGRDYELISQNSMYERTAASLAVSNKVIYLRTYKALYAIGK